MRLCAVLQAKGIRLNRAHYAFDILMDLSVGKAQKAHSKCLQRLLAYRVVLLSVLSVVAASVYFESEFESRAVKV